MTGKKLLWQHGIGLLIALIIGPIVWLAVDKRPPVEIVTQKIEGDLRPGGKVSIVWRARSLRPECIGTVRRRIVSAESGVVFEYASVESVLHDEEQTARTFRRELELPKSIPRGRAVHEVYVYYQCNAIQRFFNIYITVAREPLWFVIGE